MDTKTVWKPLTPDEAVRIEKCRATIRAGIKAIENMSRAFEEIVVNGLHRTTDEEYEEFFMREFQLSEDQFNTIMMWPTKPRIPI